MVLISRRLKAFGFDFIFGFLLPSIVIQVLISELASDSIADIEELISGLLIIPVLFCYWILSPYVSKGQTIGKWLFGIRIVSSNSEELTLRQLITRTCAYINTAMVFVKTRKLATNRQELLVHDVRADTQVVEDSRRESGNETRENVKNRS